MQQIFIKCLLCAMDTSVSKVDKMLHSVYILEGETNNKEYM